MIKLMNECVGCGLPCQGDSCPNRNVPRFYCDDCENEADLYDFYGEQLCISCIEKQLDTASLEACCDGCGDETKLYEYEGKKLCICCIESKLKAVQYDGM